MLVHELGHALQDQHTRLLEARIGIQSNDDLQFALGAFLEGDALWTELRDEAQTTGFPQSSGAEFAARFAVDAPDGAGVPRILRESFLQPVPARLRARRRAGGARRRGGAHRGAVGSAALERGAAAPRALPRAFGAPRRSRCSRSRRTRFAPEADCELVASSSYGELGVGVWLREGGRRRGVGRARGRRLGRRPRLAARLRARRGGGLADPARHRARRARARGAGAARAAGRRAGTRAAARRRAHRPARAAVRGPRRRRARATCSSSSSRSATSGLAALLREQPGDPRTRAESRRESESLRPLPCARAPPALHPPRGIDLERARPLAGPGRSAAQRGADGARRRRSREQLAGEVDRLRGARQQRPAPCARDGRHPRRRAAASSPSRGRCCARRTSGAGAGGRARRSRRSGPRTIARFRAGDPELRPGGGESRRALRVRALGGRARARAALRRRARRRRHAPRLAPRARAGARARERGYAVARQRRGSTRRSPRGARRRRYEGTHGRAAGSPASALALVALAGVSWLAPAAGLWLLGVAAWLWRRPAPAAAAWAVVGGALAALLGLALALFGEFGAGLLTGAIGAAAGFVGAQLSLAAHPRDATAAGAALGAHGARGGRRRGDEVVLARDRAGLASARAAALDRRRCAPPPSATAASGVLEDPSRAHPTAARAREARAAPRRALRPAGRGGAALRERVRAARSRDPRALSRACAPNRTARALLWRHAEGAAAHADRDPRLRHGPAGARRARLRRRCACTGGSASTSRS